MSGNTSSATVVLALFACGVLAAGCTGPRMNVSRSPNALAYAVKTVGIMPSGGVLGDAVGIELLKFGFDVVETGTVTSLMARYNLTELELAQPQNMRKLSDEGIDTILLVKSVAGYDNRPESASVKLVSTATGRLIIGATWQNGKGGAKGSAADGMMRVNLSTAARQIADGIGKELSAR